MRTGASDRIEAGLTSIVILTWNQLEYTRRCVESIRRDTPEPHEIVFVDNGSTDGTVRWLRELTAGNPRHRLIENSSNLGFPCGCNQGIAASRGEYVVLLNNDVVVTEGWLSGLQQCLERTPRGGIIGPVTNEISGRQKVERVDYEAAGGLEVWARGWRERNRDRRVPALRIVGFCMLFRRSLVEEIGLLDEDFGTGNFEDDDLCLRAEVAGYANVIAGDVFVHHYGSRTFIGNRLDRGAELARTNRIFEDKWLRLAASEKRGRVAVAVRTLDRAREAHDSGRLDAAVELFLEAIAAAPDRAFTYHALAEALIQTRSYQDALDVLLKAPKGLTEPEAQVLAAIAHEGLGEDDRARERMANALRDPGTRARALNLDGVLAHKRGDAERATACFLEAIATDPSGGEPHTNLGVLRWKQEPGEEALASLERGFVLSPTAPQAAAFYHSAARALGCLERAEAVFREARTLHPCHREITFLLVDLLISLDCRTDAMGEIEQGFETFEIDEGYLKAALAVRERVGPRQPAAGAAVKNTISLCAIVRNEERNLVRCLRTMAPVVDEIVIVDTGSNDRTSEIARALGARVFETAWQDDFSRARNEAIAKARCGWILVLDADEVIAPADFAGLRALVAKGSKQRPRDGFTMTTRNYTADASTAGWRKNDGAYAEEAGLGWYPSRKVRLFRNDERIRFEGAVHEVVEDSMAAHGLGVASSEIPVHHYGPLEAPGRDHKMELYYQLGRKKLAASGDEPGAIYELAVQAGSMGKYDEAEELWHRYLSLGTPERQALAHMNLGHVYLETGRFEEAATASRRALELDHGLREAAFNLAMSDLCTGRGEEMLQVVRALLATSPDYPPALALMVVACKLAHETAESAACLAKLRDLGQNPAVFVQECSAKLERAGREVEAARLREAAARIWREHLESHGMAAVEEQVEALMSAGRGGSA